LLKFTIVLEMLNMLWPFKRIKVSRMKKKLRLGVME